VDDEQRHRRDGWDDHKFGAHNQRHAETVLQISGAMTSDGSSSC
jgi:hypothetical protein